MVFHLEGKGGSTPLSRPIHSLIPSEGIWITLPAGINTVTQVSPRHIHNRRYANNLLLPLIFIRYYRSSTESPEIGLNLSTLCTTQPATH